MKKQQLRQVRLPLRKDTVRTLRPVELGDVDGGNVTSTLIPTNPFICTSTGC
jgi:hypothetical protein